MNAVLDAQDIYAFGVEVILCASVVFLLVLRLLKRFNNFHLGWIALLLTLLAFAVAWDQWNGGQYDPRVWTHTNNPDPGAIFTLNTDQAGSPVALDIFGGMLVHDNFTIFLRLFLLGFTGLIILLTLQTGIPDKEDSADFYVLLLGATLGMCIMASANHLMMVFIGIEMASLPSYALAGFLKGRRQSSEAALKYVVYGGGAAGVMLYGISLIAGKCGTGYLPDVAAQLGQLGPDPLILLGGLFLLIGIAFKLAAVPFHSWCPDVFEARRGGGGRVPVGSVEGRRACPPGPDRTALGRPYRRSPFLHRRPLPGADPGCLCRPDRHLRQLRGLRSD